MKLVGGAWNSLVRHETVYPQILPIAPCVMSKFSQKIHKNLFIFFFCNVANKHKSLPKWRNPTSMGLKSTSPNPLLKTRIAWPVPGSIYYGEHLWDHSTIMKSIVNRIHCHHWPPVHSNACMYAGVLTCTQTFAYSHPNNWWIMKYLLPGIILCMGSANERRRYYVMLSIIDKAHVQNDSCLE